jgi:hypothetical protein
MTLCLVKHKDNATFYLVGNPICVHKYFMYIYLSFQSRTQPFKKSFILYTPKVRYQVHVSPPLNAVTVSTPR